MQIPGVPGSEVIPRPMINPAVAGAPYAAIDRAAGDVENMALYSTQEYLKVQAAEDHVQMLKAQNEVEADKNQTIDSFKTRSDYENFAKDVTAQRDEISKKYQQKYGGNPRVMRLLQPHLDNEMTQVQQAVEMRRIGLMTDENIAELGKLRDTTQLKMAQTDDPAEKTKLASQFMESVQSSKDSGLLTAQQAYKAVVDFNLDAEKTEVITGAKSDDIRDLVRIQEKLSDKNSFPELRGHSPEWLAEKQEYVKTKIDTVNNKNKVKQAAMSSDAAVANILNQVPSIVKGNATDEDFDHALKLLDDPDLQKKAGMLNENGVTDQTRYREAKSALDGRIADSKKHRTESSDKAAKDIEKAIRGKKFADADKMIADNYSTLSHSEYQSLTTLLDKSKKHSDDDVTEGESADAYLKGTAIVDSQMPIEQQRIEIRKLRPHLKQGEFDKLVDATRKDVAKEDKSTMKTYHDKLTQFLAPGTDSMTLDMDTTKAQSRAAQKMNAAAAIQDFDKNVEEMKKKGTVSPKDMDALVAGYINSPRYLRPFDQLLADQASENEAARKTLGPKTPAKSDERKTLSLVVGKSYKDAKGDTKKYLGKDEKGKDKWQ